MQRKSDRANFLCGAIRELPLLPHRKAEAMAKVTEEDMKRTEKNHQKAGLEGRWGGQG